MEKLAMLDGTFHYPRIFIDHLGIFVIRESKRKQKQRIEQDQFIQPFFLQLCLSANNPHQYQCKGKHIQQGIEKALPFRRDHTGRETVSDICAAETADHIRKGHGKHCRSRAQQDRLFVFLYM